MEMDSSTSMRHTMTASPIWRLKSGMGNHHDTVSWGRPCKKSRLSRQIPFRHGHMRLVLRSTPKRTGE